MLDLSSRSASAPAKGKDGAVSVAAIPLVEERLSVSKRQVESGRVRVRLSVEERHETVSQEVLRDVLKIERVPCNVRVSEQPHVRHEGDKTIVPVVEERLVVEKVLMLIEEIHISRTSESETSQIPVCLRAERASIERDPEPQTQEKSGAIS